MDIPRIIQALTTRIQALEATNPTNQSRLSMHNHVMRRETAGQPTDRAVTLKDKLKMIWGYFKLQGFQDSEEYHTSQYYKFSTLLVQYNKYNAACGDTLNNVICEKYEHNIQNAYRMMLNSSSANSINYTQMIKVVQFVTIFAMLYELYAGNPDIGKRIAEALRDMQDYADTLQLFLMAQNYFHSLIFTKEEAINRIKKHLRDKLHISDA